MFYCSVQRPVQERVWGQAEGGAGEHQAEDGPGDRPPAEGLQGDVREGEQVERRCPVSAGLSAPCSGVVHWDALTARPRPRRTFTWVYLGCFSVSGVSFTRSWNTLEPIGSIFSLWDALPEKHCSMLWKPMNFYKKKKTVINVFCYLKVMGADLSETA